MKDLFPFFTFIVTLEAKSLKAMSDRLFWELFIFVSKAYKNTAFDRCIEKLRLDARLHLPRLYQAGGYRGLRQDRRPHLPLHRQVCPQVCAGDVEGRVPLRLPRDVHHVQYIFEVRDRRYI